MTNGDIFAKAAKYHRSLYMKKTWLLFENNVNLLLFFRVCVILKKYNTNVAFICA